MRESGRGHVGIRVSRGDRDDDILTRGCGRGHTGEVGGYWRGNWGEGVLAMWGDIGEGI